MEEVKVSAFEHFVRHQGNSILASWQSRGNDSINPEEILKNAWGGIPEDQIAIYEYCASLSLIIPSNLLHLRSTYSEGIPEGACGINEDLSTTKTSSSTPNSLPNESLDDAKKQDEEISQTIDPYHDQSDDSLEFLRSKALSPTTAAVSTLEESSANLQKNGPNGLCRGNLSFRPSTCLLPEYWAALGYEKDNDPSTGLSQATANETTGDLATGSAALPDKKQKSSEASNSKGDTYIKSAYDFFVADFCASGRHPGPNEMIVSAAWEALGEIERQKYEIMHDVEVARHELEQSQSTAPRKRRRSTRFKEPSTETTNARDRKKRRIDVANRIQPTNQRETQLKFGSKSVHSHTSPSSARSNPDSPMKHIFNWNSEDCNPCTHELHDKDSKVAATRLNRLATGKVPRITKSVLRSQDHSKKSPPNSSERMVETNARKTEKKTTASQLDNASMSITRTDKITASDSAEFHQKTPKNKVRFSQDLQMLSLADSMQDSDGVRKNQRNFSRGDPGVSTERRSTRLCSLSRAPTRTIAEELTDNGQETTTKCGTSLLREETGNGKAVKKDHLLLLNDESRPKDASTAVSKPEIGCIKVNPTIKKDSGSSKSHGRDSDRLQRFLQSSNLPKQITKSSCQDKLGVSEPKDVDEISALAEVSTCTATLEQIATTPKDDHMNRRAASNSLKTTIEGKSNSFDKVDCVHHSLSLTDEPEGQQSCAVDLQEQHCLQSEPDATANVSQRASDYPDKTLASGKTVRNVATPEPERCEGNSFNAGPRTNLTSGRASATSPFILKENIDVSGTGFQDVLGGPKSMEAASPSSHEISFEWPDCAQPKHYSSESNRQTNLCTPSSPTMLRNKDSVRSDESPGLFNDDFSFLANVVDEGRLFEAIDLNDEFDPTAVVRGNCQELQRIPFCTSESANDEERRADIFLH